MTVHGDFQGIHDFVVNDLGVDEVVTIKENNGTAFVDHPSRAVVTQHRESDLIPGGTIQQGDLKLIISGTKWPAGLRDLEKKDRVVIQGKPYAVVHFDRFSRNVGGSPVAYELTVRG